MLESRYTQLVAFLKAHEGLWLSPILPCWPASRAGFPEPWLAYVSTLLIEDQRAFENGQLIAGMPDGLAQIIHQAAGHCKIETFEECWPLNSQDVQGLTLKKQHEISRLLAFLACETQSVTHAVDIGGGMGHLARLCVKYFQWDFHSIDRDRALQDKGRWWIKRRRDGDRERLKFVLAELSNQANPEIDGLLALKQTLSLGLHTCGALALNQFQRSLRSEVIINFGCCFDKMDPASDLNRSQLAQRLNLPWSQAALFLATRSRQGLTREEFALLRRVNDYRFALDLWFRRHYPERGFVVAGDAPKALYAQDFASYAHDRLTKLKMPHNFTAHDFSIFYEDDIIQKDIAALFAAHLIRDLMARPLELAILLDRGLWLAEQGLEVRLIEIFDRRQSPRNIAIIARPS